MAKGKLKKEATGQIPSTQSLIKFEPALPALADQTFGSVRSSRVYQTDFSSSLTRFSHLKDGIMPFQVQDGYISVKDAVWLCQKAYFNVSIFKNAINTMAELCNTDVYLKGGNKQSRDFFTAWLNRINIRKLKDTFFREIFRSGNVFLFRVDGEISKSEALKLNQAYAAVGDLSIPLRYIMLNVADIVALDSITFDDPAYFKVLTSQQMKLLKKSSNPDDKEVYKNLAKSIKDYFDGSALGSPIPIDLNKLHTIFYQKQDYEPFAVPFGFAVLDDINFKLELKRTDAILARTAEQATLVITSGEKIDEKGNGGVSPKVLAALREAFSKEQIGRVIVADYTTKLEWSIPDLAKVLGPEKYKVVNEDIANGLMDVFFGEQRFASVITKLKIFAEKLNKVQELFLNDFLQSEIRRVAEMMNFKSYPEAQFVEVNLDDPTQMMRIYAQLLQLGVFTAKDGIEAMRTGDLPEFENLVENHKEYKTLKDDGLFQPIVSQYPPERVAEAQAKFPKPVTGTGKPANPTGRPPGTKAPQTTKKISPVGTGSEQKFSMAKLIDTAKLMDRVKNKLAIAYKKENKVKRLIHTDKDLIDQISKTLFENENPDEWESKIEEYIKEPLPPDIDRELDIEEIATEYELSPDAAILLYHSKI